MSESGENSLPCTREVLCEHVYALVQTFSSENAELLTGAVTDGRSENELHLMLQDHNLLQRLISEATLAFKNSSVVADKAKPDVESCPLDKEKEEIGNILFDRVAEIESELCAQVTGMLLELSIPALTVLLEDVSQLEAAVVKAKCEYLRQCHPHTLPSRDELGQEIYELVYHSWPDHAAKITGMLLELDEVRLQQLLDSPTELNRSVKQALKALNAKH